MAFVVNMGKTQEPPHTTDMNSGEMLNTSLIGIGIAAIAYANAATNAGPVSNASANASSNANVVVVEDKVEEEAKEVCARQHSGIRLWSGARQCGTKTLKK